MSRNTTPDGEIDQERVHEASCRLRHTLNRGEVAEVIDDVVRFCDYTIQARTIKHAASKSSGAGRMDAFPDISDRAELSCVMSDHGGSFVAMLGEALRQADSDNARLIYKTWPAIIERYRNWNKGDEQ